MQKWHIGIDSGDSLVAEEIVGLLIERGFPYDSIALYGDNDSLGEAVEVGDHEFPICLRGQGLDNPPDILFITNDAANDEEPIKAKLTISAKPSMSNQNTLVIPEINSLDIHSGCHEKLILVPSPAATAIATTVKPLEEVLGLARLHCTTVEPVSNWGKAGLEIFVDQIHHLLNGQEPENHERLGDLAFNFLPFVGPMMPKNPQGSVATSELLLNKELGRFLNCRDISSIRTSTPVFYGLGALIEGEFNEDITLEKARELLKNAPGLMLIDEEEREPIALREVVGSDAIMVGRLQLDLLNKKRLRLWVSLDNLRKGCATSMVEIAEIAIRDHSDCLLA